MGTNRIDIGRLTGARGHSPSVAPTKSSVFEEIQPTLIQYASGAHRVIASNLNCADKCHFPLILCNRRGVSLKRPQFAGHFLRASHETPLHFRNFRSEPLIMILMQLPCRRAAAKLIYFQSLDSLLLCAFNSPHSFLPRHNSKVNFDIDFASHCLYFSCPVMWVDCALNVAPPTLGFHFLR